MEAILPDRLSDAELRSVFLPRDEYVPGGGGGSGLTLVDNGDGTATLAGDTLTDNGDGTLTIAA